MIKDYLKALKNRRSYYNISDKSPIGDDELQKLVEEVVQNVPSAFNSQPFRVVLLLGDNHKKLWDITMETLRKIVPAENFGSTEAKINSFKAGYGSILFFEDELVTTKLQETYPLYKDNFPTFASQTSGMIQLAMWVALEAEGFGASIQHYNPIIDEEVKSVWGISPNWKLTAQMPFGVPTAEAKIPEMLPVSEKVKVFK